MTITLSRRAKRHLAPDLSTSACPVAIEAARQSRMVPMKDWYEGKRVYPNYTFEEAKAAKQPMTWWDALQPSAIFLILASGVVIGWMLRTEAPHQMRWWLIGVYRQLAALATQLGLVS